MYYGLMAYRGSYIMDGYLPGKGMVRVFQDMDNANYFFCDSKSSDRTFYVARGRVQPRKVGRKAAPVQTPEKEVPSTVQAVAIQPTLF